MESTVEKRGISKLDIVVVVCVVTLAFASVALYKLNKQLISLHNELSYAHNELSDSYTRYSNYVANHQYTNSEYEEATFSFYYVKPQQQRFGVYNLSDTLDGLKWIYSYQKGVFDCSEMSASLEWHLENNGWRTTIVVGDSPFGSGRHAWLLVETSQGEYMPVESTTLEVVWWSNSYFDNYFLYDHTFETIQEAMAYSEGEFDWWD